MGSLHRAYKNGINGMVVHKTDRASLVGNVIWDNGQVSRDSRCIFPLLDKYVHFEGKKGPVENKNSIR